MIPHLSAAILRKNKFTMRNIFNKFKIKYIKMSLGTTSISELPVSTTSGQPPNVQLHARETNQALSTTTEQLNTQRANEDAQLLQQKQSPPNPQDFIKQVESDVHASKGQLQLPQRDIPRENNHITQDTHVKPNYIPEGPDDYIKKYQTNEIVQEVNKKKEEKSKNMEFLYEELQTPILISLIYFLFQLPVVKKTLIKNIPKLFKNDGNLNTQGYLFNSILFGSSYYLLTKAINYIAE